MCVCVPARAHSTSGTLWCGVAIVAGGARAYLLLAGKGIIGVGGQVRTEALCPPLFNGDRRAVRGIRQ
jgi:hypothetical protein